MRAITLLLAIAAANCTPARAEESSAKPHVDSPLGFVNNHLPSWVRLSGELRSREEGFLASRFIQGNDDMYLLQRVRLGLEVHPSPWLHFFVQGQDSRVSFADRVEARPPLQNSADLRQAYVQLGAREAGWLDFTLGRQELVFGEERLVGAGNWGNVARTFDAIKLGLHRGRTRFDLFASSVVVPRDHLLDRHSSGDNLLGIYGHVGDWIPKGAIEPYVLRHLSPSVMSERGAQGRLDTWTTGVRSAGQFFSQSEYTMEIAAQNGSWGTDSVRAWAGFLRLGHEFSKSLWHPRLRLEFNHASGDGNPTDGRHHTFDVLYPTPHDKYGLADQVGWKNIYHGGFIFEVKPSRNWTVQAKAHNWWLASARDGLYSAGGALLIRDITGRSGQHVGEELDFQMMWAAQKHVSLAGGIGHMFPGDFLRHSTPGRAYTFPYVQLTYGL